MNKILVTGGAGYIGSHTAKALAKAGYEPVVVDSMESGHAWAVKWGPLHQINLADRDALRRLFADNRFDAVIHFAASIAVGESMKAPGKYLRNNVVNALNVLEAMVESGVGTIVFSSTAAVYGAPERVPIPEDHPLRPSSTYGETKLMVERMLHWFSIAHGLKWAALRYFNAAGADPEGELGEAHPEETHLIPLAIRATRGPEHALHLFGTDYPSPDGTAIRDYIHVTDLGSAHVLAMKYLRDGGSSAAFNLGTGNGVTVREILRAVENVSGKSVYANESPRRPGDPPSLVADSAKAQRDFGWTPEHSSIEEIVQTAWAWEQRPQ